uniref:Mur ligase C-terminal domain-containing protein n=1 Tax=Panagrolaimus superbus TaxID=310955 RepID=A0A914YNB9_9BILA
MDGVQYLDDSKGTNVGATVAALRGFDQRVWLIAGGLGKGQDFEPLAVAAASCGRSVLIGQDAKLIASVLDAHDVRYRFCEGLEAAVQAAAEQAHSGDVVLLLRPAPAWICSKAITIALTSGVNAVRPGRTALPAFDRPLLAATLMLTLFGLLMVYSASIALADGPRYESYGRYYFVIRHALFIVVGCGAGHVYRYRAAASVAEVGRASVCSGYFLAAGGAGSRHWP